MKVYVLLYIGDKFSVLILWYVPKPAPYIASFCVKSYEKKLQIYHVFIRFDVDRIFGFRVQNYYGDDIEEISGVINLL